MFSACGMKLKKNLLFFNAFPDIFFPVKLEPFRTTLLLPCHLFSPLSSPPPASLTHLSPTRREYTSLSFPTLLFSVLRSHHRSPTGRLKGIHTGWSDIIVSRRPGWRSGNDTQSNAPRWPSRRMEGRTHTSDTQTHTLGLVSNPPCLLSRGFVPTP